MKDYSPLLALFLDHLGTYRAGLTSAAPKELYDPEHYILSLGGKRLRPLLALIACDLLGSDPKKALPSAMAVELFHNFSLVHDDILDAAPLRRNQATVHTKWNTNIAILSGDMILVKAFQTLEQYAPEEFRSLFSLFSRTAIQVCEGQQLDMNFESAGQVSVEDYLHMITNKTAVLLGCSLQMGAINAGAEEHVQQDLYRFGMHLGIAFQLLDDLLDAMADDAEKFGKQPGGDILANKKTFLLLKAMELASAPQRREIDRVLGLGSDKATEKINAMLALYTSLGIKELCREEADKHTRLAIGFMERLPVAEPKKQALRLFALELLDRQV